MEVFAELREDRCGGAVIAANPELAVPGAGGYRRRRGGRGTHEQQAGRYRANALQTVISDVGAVLRGVAPLPSNLLPVEEPSVEGNPY